ncbi:hypothetical protein FOLKNPGA_02361 [Legionella sp. PC1000]|uniref:hypothetical protein n=1 Tax=Legionella sp. PC1000 TaxID=2746060 RepID=UPI0015F7E234|nr:hypothetical protein [Legionella sp. PC1000]QLZ69567.1 hypothetical protein FOLKNPGA_02361 [Legionella sp. PC1000]
MLTDALLDRTVIILSSYSGQTKKDPSFDLYKLGIKNAFIGFIEQCKLLPLDQQFEHIAKEMKEKTGGMAAKIDQESSQKRTWTLVFTLAALALGRKQDLPANPPEMVPIDKLISGLSNGWVHGFGSIGFGLKLNEEAINNLIEGMKDWIQNFDINQDMQTQHEVLLALYAVACSLEEKLSSYRIVPKKFKDEMATIKILVANKFNELKNKLESESSLAPAEFSTQHASRSEQVSNALQVLLPKEVTLHQQFKEQLEFLKKQQEERRQKINSFPQEKFNRLLKLHQLLKEQPSANKEDKMSEFWKKYNTQEKFNQLMDDLELSESEKPGWLEYFRYQHGSYAEQAISTLWIGSWGLPEFMGGVQSDMISLEVLLSKCETAQKPLKAIHAEQQKIIPDEENPSQLIDSIEKDLKNLAGLKKIKIDSFDKQLLDSMKGDTTINTLGKINSDIEELKENLVKQKIIIVSLKNIHEKIELLKKHVDCTDIEKTFALLLDEVINTMSYMEHPLPPDVPTAKKIAVLNSSIGRALDNVAGIQLSINHIVNTSSSHKLSMIKLVNQFVSSKENTWGHTLLLIFSPSYKKMFNELKEALTEKDTETSLNKIKAALDLTNEPANKKEIAKQFKGLKERAKETLDEENLGKMPVFEKNR